MKFEIKSRWNASILFTIETESLKLAVEAAVKAKANLDGANLVRANLDGANLDGANLDGANLVRANLYGANLVRANLYGANLYGANLYGANLYGANLYGANLDGANLVRANLYGANLYGANLYGANNIPESYKLVVRDDIWAILSAAPAEVEGLRQAILEGRINGSSYHGACSCLVGTIANVRQVDIDRLDLIKPNANRPAEQWFLRIETGDTPETNPFAAWALECVDVWLANVRSAFAGKAVK